MAIVCVDFDGTCVTHEFPRVGRFIGAQRVLKRLVDEGHQLILWTMRSDVEEPSSQDTDIHAEGGDYLTQAVKWFERFEIPLLGINSNPEQGSWTHSPKAYAHLYIDDAALGIPLVYGYTERPYVNWNAVEDMLESMGYLRNTKLDTPPING